MLRPEAFRNFSPGPSGEDDDSCIGPYRMLSPLPDHPHCAPPSHLSRMQKGPCRSAHLSSPIHPHTANKPGCHSGYGASRSFCTLSVPPTTRAANSGGYTDLPYTVQSPGPLSGFSTTASYYPAPVRHSSKEPSYCTGGLRGPYSTRLSSEEIYACVDGGQPPFPRVPKPGAEGREDASSFETSTDNFTFQAFGTGNTGRVSVVSLDLDPFSRATMLTKSRKGSGEGQSDRRVHRGLGTAVSGRGGKKFSLRKKADDSKQDDSRIMMATTPPQLALVEQEAAGERRRSPGSEEGSQAKANGHLFPYKDIAWMSLQGNPHYAVAPEGTSMSLRLRQGAGGDVRNSGTAQKSRGSEEKGNEIDGWNDSNTSSVSRVQANNLQWARQPSGSPAGKNNFSSCGCNSSPADGEECEFEGYTSPRRKSKPHSAASPTTPVSFSSMSPGCPFSRRPVVARTSSAVSPERAYKGGGAFWNQRESRERVPTRSPVTLQVPGGEQPKRMTAGPSLPLERRERRPKSSDYTTESIGSLRAKQGGRPRSKVILPSGPGTRGREIPARQQLSRTPPPGGLRTSDCVHKDGQQKTLHPVSVQGRLSTQRSGTLAARDSRALSHHNVTREKDPCWKRCDQMQVSHSYHQQQNPSLRPQGVFSDEDGGSPPFSSYTLDAQYPDSAISLERERQLFDLSFTHGLHTQRKEAMTTALGPRSYHTNWATEGDLRPHFSRDPSAAPRSKPRGPSPPSDCRIPGPGSYRPQGNHSCRSRSPMSPHITSVSPRPSSRCPHSRSVRRGHSNPAEETHESQSSEAVMACSPKSSTSRQGGGRGGKGGVIGRERGTGGTRTLKGKTFRVATRKVNDSATRTAKDFRAGSGSTERIRSPQASRVRQSARLPSRSPGMRGENSADIGPQYHEVYPHGHSEDKRRHVRREGEPGGFREMCCEMKGLGGRKHDDGEYPGSPESLLSQEQREREIAAYWGGGWKGDLPSTMISDTGFAFAQSRVSPYFPFPRESPQSHLYSREQGRRGPSASPGRCSCQGDREAESCRMISAAVSASSFPTFEELQARREVMVGKTDHTIVKNDKVTQERYHFPMESQSPRDSPPPTVGHASEERDSRYVTRAHKALSSPGELKTRSHSPAKRGGRPEHHHISGDPSHQSYLPQQPHQICSKGTTTSQENLDARKVPPHYQSIPPEYAEAGESLEPSQHLLRRALEEMLQEARLRQQESQSFLHAQQLQGKLQRELRGHLEMQLAQVARAQEQLQTHLALARAQGNAGENGVLLAECVEQLRLEVVREGERQRQLLRKHQMLLEEEERQTRLWRRDTNGGTAPDQSIDKTDRDLRETPQRSQGLEDISDVCSRTGGRFLETSAGQRDGTGRRDSSPSVKGHGIRHTEDDNREKEEENQRPLSHLCSPSFPQVSHTSSSPTLGSHSRGRSRERLPRPLSSAATSVPAMRRGSSEFEEETQDCDRRASIGAIGHPTSRGRQPSAVLQKESGDIHRPLHQERGLERSPATSQMSTLKHGGGQDPQRVAYSGGDGVGRCEHCTPQMQWIQRERLRLAREKQILHQQMVEHQELSRAPQVGAHTSQGLRSTTGQDTTSGASSEQGGQGACSGLSLEARQEHRRAYAPSCRPKKLGYTPPATPKSSANTVRKSNQRLSKPRTGSSGSSSLPQTEQVPTMQLASMTGCKSGRTVRTGMVTVKATRQGIATVQGKAEPVVANSKVVIGMLDKGSSQCPSVSSAEGAGRAAIVRGASGTGDVSATPRGDSDSARKRTPLQSQRLARQRLCEQKRLEQKAAAAAAAELQRKRENLLKLSEERRRRLEQHLSRQNSGGRGRARLRGKTHVSHHDTGKAEGRPASPSSSATGVDQSVRGEPQVTSVLRKDEVVKTSKSGSSCQFARETLGPAMVSSTSPSASSTKQRICVEEPRQKSPELSHGGGVVGQEGEKRESRTDGRGSDMGDVRPCSLTPGPWISADSGKATEGGSDVCRLASGLSVSLQNSGVCPGCTGLRRFLSHPSLHSTSSAFAANTVNRSHIPVPSRCVCHHHGSHGNAAASPPLTSDDVTGKREQQRDGFVSNPSSFSHQTHHNDPNVYISRGVGTQGTSSQPPVFLPCSVGQHMAPGGCAYRGDVCPYRNVVSLPHTCTSMIPGKGVPTPSTAHVVFFTPAGPAIGLCSHGEFRPPQGLLTPCHLSRTPGVGEGTCARCACGRALTQPPGEIRTERAENAKTEKEAAEEKEQEGQVWQSKQRVSPRRQDSPKVSERESFPVVTAADPENSRGEKKGGLVNSSPRKIPGQECLLRAVAERRKLESEPSHIRPAGVTEGPMTPERQSPVSSAAAASSMPRSEDEAALAARQARFELERQMTERLLAKMRQTRSQPQRQSPAEVACRADSQAKGTTTPSFRASSHPSHIDSSRHEGGRRSSIEEGEIVLDAVTQKTFVALSSPSTPVHGESGRVSVPLLEFHEVSVKPLMTTPDCREGASLELENSPEYPSPQSASKFLDAATSPVQVLHPSSSSRFRSCPSPCTRTQSSSYRVHPPLRGIREGEEESISERREREEADIRSPMERNQRCHQQVISPRGRGGGVLDDSTVNERGTGPRVSGRHVDICTGVPTYSLVSREIPLTSSDLASTTRHHSSSPRFVRRSYINEQESKMVRDRALSPVMVLSPRGHHNGEKQQYRSISCFPRLQPVDPRETTRAAPLPPHRRPPVISSVPYREPTVAQHLSFSSPRSSSAVPRLSSNSSLLNTAQPDVSPSVKSAPNFPARTGELSSPPALRPTRGTDLHSTSPATTRRLLRSPKSATSALASDLRNVSPCLSICQGAKSGNFNERSSAPLKVTDLRDGVSSRDSPTRHELFNTNVPLPSSCSSSDTKTHLTRASVPQQSSSAVTAHQGKSSGGLLQPTPSMSLSSPEALVSRLAAASKKCSTKQDLLKEMLKEICEIVREEAAQGNAPELALLRGVTGQDDSVEGAQGMMMNATALSVSKTLGASVTSSGGRCSENQEKYEKIETVVSQQEERFLSSYSQDLSPGMLCTSGKKGDEDEKNIHPRVQPSPSSTGMHASGRLLSSRSPMGLAGNFHESEKQDPRVLAGSKDVGMIGRSDSSSLGSSLRRSQLSSSLKEDEVFHPTGSPNALNPPPSSLSSSFRRAQDNRPGALSSSLFSRPASPKFRTPPLSPFPISAGVFSSSLSSPIGQEGSPPSLGLAPSALSGGAVHQEEKKLEGGHIKSIREKKKQLPAALQPGALRSPRSPRPARHYSMSPPTNPISPVSEALSALKKTVPPDDVQKQEELVAAVVNAVMDKWRQEYGLLPVARGSREGQKKNKERSASEGEATDQVSEIEEKFFGRSVDEEEPGTTKEKSGKSKVRETCHLSGDLLGISAPVECECRSDGDKREVLQANKDSRRMKDRSPTFLCASSASSPRVDTPHLSNQGVDRRAATPREQLSASGSPVGNRSPSRSPFIFSSTCAEHPRSLSPTYRQQLPAFPRSISPPSHQKVQEGVKLQCPSSPRIDNFGVPLRHEKKEDMYRPENLPCAAAPDRAKQTAIVTAVCREAVALAFLGSPRDGRKGLMSPSSVQGEELSISGAVTLSPVPSVKSPAASCAEDRGQCRVVDSYADRNRTAEKTKDEVPDAKAKGAGGVSMRHGEGALCAEDGKKESPVRAKRGSPREGISIVTASHEVSLEPGEVTETSCMRVEETCVAVQRKRIEEGDGKRGDKGEVKDTSSLILAQLDEDRRRTPEFVDNISRRGNEEAVDGQRLSSMPCTHPSVVPAPSETKKEGMPHLRGSSSLSPPYNSHPSPWPQLAPIALSPTNKDGRSNGDVQQLADLEPGIDQKIDPTGRVPGSAFRVASLSPKREYGKPTALDKQAVSPSYAGGLHSPTDKRPRGSSVQRREKQSSESPLTSPRSVSPISPSHPAAVVPPTRVRHSAPSSPRSEREEVQLSSLAPTSRLISSPREADSSTAHRREIPPGICSPSSPSVALLSPCSRGQQQRSGVFASFETRQQAALLSPCQGRARNGAPPRSETRNMGSVVEGGIIFLDRRIAEGRHGDSQNSRSVYGLSWTENQSCSPPVPGEGVCSPKRHQYVPCSGETGPLSPPKTQDVCILSPRWVEKEMQIAGELSPTVQRRPENRKSPRGEVSSASSPPQQSPREESVSVSPRNKQERKNVSCSPLPAALSPAARRENSVRSVTAAAPGVRPPEMSSENGVGALPGNKREVIERHMAPPPSSSDLSKSLLPEALPVFEPERERNDDKLSCTGSKREAGAREQATSDHLVRLPASDFHALDRHGSELKWGRQETTTAEEGDQRLAALGGTTPRGFEVPVASKGRDLVQNGVAMFSSDEDDEDSDGKSDGEVPENLGEDALLQMDALAICRPLRRSNKVVDTSPEAAVRIAFALMSVRRGEETLDEVVTPEDVQTSGPLYREIHTLVNVGAQRRGGPSLRISRDFVELILDLVEDLVTDPDHCYMSINTWQVGTAQHREKQRQNVLQKLPALARLMKPEADGEKKDNLASKQFTWRQLLEWVYSAASQGYFAPISACSPSSWRRENLQHPAFMPLPPPPPSVSDSLPGMSGADEAPVPQEDLIGLAFAYHKGADRLVRHRSRLPSPPPNVVSLGPHERVALPEAAPRAIRVSSNQQGTTEKDCFTPDRRKKTKNNGVSPQDPRNVRLATSPYSSPCVSPLGPLSGAAVGSTEERGGAEYAAVVSLSDDVSLEGFNPGEQNKGSTKMLSSFPVFEVVTIPSRDVCEEDGKGKVSSPSREESPRQVARICPQHAAINNADLPGEQHRCIAIGGDEGSGGRTERGSDLESLPSSPSSSFSENSFLSRSHPLRKHGRQEARSPLRLPPCLATSQELPDIECLAHPSPRSPFSAVASPSSRPSSGGAYVRRTNTREKANGSNPAVSPKEFQGQGEGKEASESDAASSQRFNRRTARSPSGSPKLRSNSPARSFPWPLSPLSVSQTAATRGGLLRHPEELSPSRAFASGHHWKKEAPSIHDCASLSNRSLSPRSESSSRLQSSSPRGLSLSPRGFLSTSQETEENKLASTRSGQHEETKQAQRPQGSGERGVIRGSRQQPLGVQSKGNVAAKNTSQLTPSSYSSLSPMRLFAPGEEAFSPPGACLSLPPLPFSVTSPTMQKAEESVSSSFSGAKTNKDEMPSLPLSSVTDQRRDQQLAFAAAARGQQLQEGGRRERSATLFPTEYRQLSSGEIVVEDDGISSAVSEGEVKETRLQALTFSQGTN